MTPPGEAVAVWRHFDTDNEGNYVIQASTRPPGGSFSAPLDVAVTPNEALPQDLHVVVNAAGDTAVVWTQQEPNSGLSPNPTFVDASVRPAGGSFSAPTTISTLPLVAGQSARTPRVAIDTAGDVAVVWGYDNGINNGYEKHSPKDASFTAGQLAADAYEATLPASIGQFGYQGCVYTLARGLENQLASR